MRTYTLLASVVIHAALVGTAFVAHLVATDEVPLPRNPLEFVQVLPVPEPHVAVRVSQRRPVTSAPSLEQAAEPQPEIAIVPSPGPVSDVPDQRAGVLTFGTPTSIGGEPPPPVPPPAPASPLPVGGAISPPRKVFHVAPVYPDIARAAGITGVVILEAVIGEDGRVRDVRVLRSVPLLDQAAADAVRRWVFTPTLLNGQPVPVVMTVTVGFALR
jgi:periplasmic protein TonB